MLMISVVTGVTLTGWGEGWLRIGPNEDLAVGRLKIDTWASYGSLVIIICFLKVFEVSVNEFLYPIFWWMIYDREAKDLGNYTTNEVKYKYVFNNSMSGLRSIFAWYIAISQFDLAVIQLLSEQVTSFFVVHLILRGKYNGVSETSILMGEVPMGCPPMPPHAIVPSPLG